MTIVDLNEIGSFVLEISSFLIVIKMDVFLLMDGDFNLFLALPRLHVETFTFPGFVFFLVIIGLGLIVEIILLTDDFIGGDLDLLFLLFFRFL